MSIYGHMYGPGLRYDIGKDQTDLNKYAGLYFKKYQPHVRTTMLTYYYDPKKDQMFWTFYHHGVKNVGNYKAVGRVPGYVNLENHLYTDVGECPDYHIKIIDRYNIELAAEYKGKVITDKISFVFQIDKWITEANFWHGGNMPAQDDVSVSKARTNYRFKGIDHYL